MTSTDLLQFLNILPCSTTDDKDVFTVSLFQNQVSIQSFWTTTMTNFKPTQQLL